MAVGVDYSLFYLKREREERQRGRSTIDAIEIAAATSGRAVVVSGFAVMVVDGRPVPVGRSRCSTPWRPARSPSSRLRSSARSRCCRRCWPSSAAGSTVLASRCCGGSTVASARVASAVASYARSSVVPVVSAVIAGGVLLGLAVPAFGMKTAPGHDRHAAAGHPRGRCLPAHAGELPDGASEHRRGRCSRRTADAAPTSALCRRSQADAVSADLAIGDRRPDHGLRGRSYVGAHAVGPAPRGRPAQRCLDRAAPQHHRAACCRLGRRRHHGCRWRSRRGLRLREPSVEAAAGHRVRPGPDADHDGLDVPQRHDRAAHDGAQPAVGRSRVRCPDAGVPARLVQRPARHRVVRASSSTGSRCSASWS